MEAGPGARLRQDQREIGRPVEWMRAFAVGVGVVILAGKRRLRLGYPIIVFEPVGQQQRAAALLLGVLGQFDGRRLVGDDLERPARKLGSIAERARLAGLLDREPDFGDIATLSVRLAASLCAACLRRRLRRGGTSSAGGRCGG